MLDLNNLFAVINNCSSISLVMLIVQIRVKSIPSLLNRPIDRGRSIFLPWFNSFFFFSRSKYLRQQGQQKTEKKNNNKNKKNKKTVHKSD